MANYLYNGIELPALPEWDKEKYPYAVLWTSRVTSDSTLKGVYVWALDHPAQYDPSTYKLTTQAGAKYYAIRKLWQISGKEDDWGKYGEDVTEYGAIATLYPDRYGRTESLVWSDHDVYTPNGVLYLKASDPVPVPDELETVLAWQKHDAYKPNSKSIAYLYNGVELPDINTVWTDKATYPCAIITRGIPNGTYYLTVCGDKPYYTEQAHSTDGYEPIVVAPKPFNGFGYVVGSWVLNIEDTGYGAALRTGTFELIWTNVDVMNKDNGSVYFNGSDPVIKGWDGNTFYRVMGGKWVKQDEFASDAKAEPEVENCLTFSSAEAFTIATNNAAKNWDGALYHSTDGNTWSEWDGVTAIESAKHNGEQRVYVRGVGNSVITGGDFYTDVRWVLTGSSIRCDGNIENLLDYETVAAGRHPEMGARCFGRMFSYNTNLTSAPDLPATELTEWCYYNMFKGCDALTTAPELPATKLAARCYQGMFDICDALTTAPELPATVMADICYSHMFCGCKKLTSAPKIHAVTLAYACFAHMFENCTSLTNAPALKATSLTEECYYWMFRGCTALTVIPELPATTLVKNCYRLMFAECPNVKISETRTDEYQTAYRIPKEGTGTMTDEDDVYGMFNYTGGTFTGTPEINKTYYTSNTVV